MASESVNLTEARECPNPYCEDGMVTCEGGAAKGRYRVPCRVHPLPVAGREALAASQETER